MPPVTFVPAKRQPLVSQLCIPPPMTFGLAAHGWSRPQLSTEPAKSSPTSVHPCIYLPIYLSKYHSSVDSFLAFLFMHRGCPLFMPLLQGKGDDKRALCGFCPLRSNLVRDKWVMRHTVGRLDHYTQWPYFDLV